MSMVSRKERNVEFLLLILLVIQCIASRSPGVGVICRTVNKTQKQDRKQIEALLFDALQSLLPVTSCYQTNDAHEHISSVQYPNVELESFSTNDQSGKTKKISVTLNISQSISDYRTEIVSDMRTYQCLYNIT